MGLVVVANRGRRGENRLVDCLLREFDADSREVRPHGPALATDDVALGARAHPSEHGLALVDPALSLEQLCHRRQAAPLRLRHGQHVGGRLPDVGPRTRCNRQRRHLRNGPGEQAGLRHRDQIFGALIRQGECPDGGGSEFRRRRGLGEDSLQYGSLFDAAMGSDRGQQP